MSLPTLHDKHPIQKLLLLIVLLLFVLPSSNGQISLLSLQNDNNLTYKKAIKESRKTGVPILAILYSPDYPVKSTNHFINAKAIIQEAGVTPVVIDWANNLNRKPQKKVNVLNNPMWLYIHPDDIMVNGKYEIINDDQLKEFLASSQVINKELSISIEQKVSSKSKKDLLKLAQVSTKTADEEYMSDLLTEYLKRATPKDLTNENLKTIIRVASRSPLSKRVYRMLTDNKKRAIALTSADSVYHILQANIYADLKRTGELYPFEVWQRYEQELGHKADSLYRIFAIHHFSEPPIDKVALYNECFDFINIYPHASWELLDALYSMVVPAATKKEDLEVLLDLIAFQLSREESHRQLDYKALILYKMGEEEKALGMVNQILSKAAEKKIRYRSMLYSIKG